MLQRAISDSVMRAVTGPQRPCRGVAVLSVPGRRGGPGKRTAGCELRVDYGDGECVPTALRGQPDLLHLLLSVGAAGLRRRGANGFPTHGAPLLRDLSRLDPAHEYMTWPRGPRPE